MQLPNLPWISETSCAGSGITCFLAVDLLLLCVSVEILEMRTLSPDDRH